MNKDPRKPAYIGDAVYVKLHQFGFELTTDSHESHQALQRIVLEDSVFDNLAKYVQQHRLEQENKSNIAE